MLNIEWNATMQLNNVMPKSRVSCQHALKQMVSYGTRLLAGDWPRH